MGGETNLIKRDAEGNPAPQYFNPTTDDYEYVEGENGGLGVKVVGSESLSAGSITATTSAAYLGADAACSEILLQADPDNSVDVFVGNSSSQPIQLGPGASMTIPCKNINVVYVKTASSTGVVNFLYRS